MITRKKTLKTFAWISSKNSAPEEIDIPCGILYKEPTPPTQNKAYKGAETLQEKK
jgi:hypothetical protein